ncbi:gelsolin-like [Ruditapes philippinarum]|uniref:gelsolin-like n=1 Tax=Ruditapes philippinarum TaxID=129788 RepID=UPI00295B16C0|nr:gelsolin-like [Ruditapes philippinarum]
MTDQAFRNINPRQPCFLIWRVENMNVVAVPKPQYGVFYKGDSYIVLSFALPGQRRGASSQVKEGKGSCVAHIHFWLGKETSQDEAGVAAFKCVELDDCLGGFPVQHREVQDSESKLFLSYFKNGIMKSFIIDNGRMGFIKKKAYPNHTKVTRVIEGGEPSDFKCLFKSWPMPVATGKAYNNNKIAKTVQTKFDASTLHSNRALAAETRMVDDGSGNAEIWRVVDFDLKPVLKQDIGMFYGGDCYVILYTYQVNGREHYIVYYWQGLQASQDEKGTSALKAVEIDDKLGGAAVQVRVVMNKEPQHFTAMFDGKMIIFSGGHCGWTGGPSSDGPGDSYMLQVRGTNIYNTKALQVPMEAASLNSNDVFVIFTKKCTFIWCGKGSTGDERQAAKNVAARSPREATIVIEGQEKAAFWEAIGGQAEYLSDKRLQQEESEHPPRLFQISNASGSFTCEEIPEFVQQDLCTDDCMMLDLWDDIYIWVGANARDDEKKEAERLAMEYLNSDPADRDQETPIYRIRQGCEPPTFTGFFGVWDDDFFKNSQDYKELGQQLASNNDAVVLVQESMDANGGVNFDEMSKYPLAELQVNTEDLPSGVDPKCKEMFLTADDFMKTFNMTYTEFLGKPLWKQQAMKKAAKLF